MDEQTLDPEAGSGFDISAARAVGRTDPEILDMLAKRHGFNIDAARSVGKKDPEILEHLAKLPYASSPAPVSSPLPTKQVKQTTAQPQVPIQAPAPPVDVTAPVPGMEKLVPPGQPAQPPGNPLIQHKGNVAPSVAVPGLNAPEESQTGNLLTKILANAPQTGTVAGVARPPKITTASAMSLPKQIADTALIEGPSNVYGGAQQLFTPGQKLQGATRILRGTNEMATPLAIAGGVAGMVARPVATGLAMAGASLLPAMAKKATAMAGGDQPEQEFAQEAAGSPIVLGLAGRGISPTLAALGKLDSALGKTSVGAAIQSKLRPVIDAVNNKLDPWKAWMRFQTEENLGSLDADPKVQTQVRAAVQEVGHTLAKDQVLKDMPKIHDAIRETGLPEEAFHHALQHSRLQGREKWLADRGSEYENVSPLEVVKNLSGKRVVDEKGVPVEEAGVIAQAAELNRNYNTKTDSTIRQILQDTGDVNSHLDKWIDDNFAASGTDTVRMSNGRTMSRNRAEEIFTREVAPVAEQLERDALRDPKMQDQLQATPMQDRHLLLEQVHNDSLQSASQAFRIKSLMARTYNGLAKAVGENRETQLPLRDMYGKSFDDIIKLPGFQKALSVYKYGKTPEELKALGMDITDPAHSATVDAWQSLTGGEHPGNQSIEGLYKRHHNLMEGEETEHGPLGTYYPLLVGDKSGNGRRFTDVFKSRYRPFNPAGFFSAGLGNEYSTNVKDLTNHLGTMIYQGRKAEAVSMLDQAGSVTKYTGDAEKVPDGYTVLPVKPDTYERVQTPTGTITVRRPGESYIAPYQLARELKPWLERNTYRGAGTAGEDPQQIAGNAISGMVKTNLLGPADNMSFLYRAATGLPIGMIATSSQHPNPMIRYGEATPGLGMLIGGLRGGLNAAKIDPTKPETITTLREMINAGALSPRYARVTGNSQLARDTGIDFAPKWWGSEAKNTATAAREFGRYATGQERSAAPKDMYYNPVESLDAFLYGPMESNAGLDARIRMTLWDAHKSAYPNGSPAERAKFVNELGNYNNTLTSNLERNLSNSMLGVAIAPFIRTGAATYRMGLRSALGVHAMPEAVPDEEQIPAYVRSQVASGMAGYLTTWAALNYATNGKWPWDDPQGGKVGAVRLNPWMVKNLVEPVLGPQGDKPVYVDALKLPYWYTDKGMQALGIRGGLNEAMIQGRGTLPPSAGNMEKLVRDSVVANDGRTVRLLMNGFARDAANALLQPAGMGPASSAAFSAMGVKPYMTQLGPPEGVAFLPNRNKNAQSGAGELGRAAMRVAGSASGLEGLSDFLGGSQDIQRMDTTRMNPGQKALYNLMPYILTNRLTPYTAMPERQQKREMIPIRRLNREEAKAGELAK